VNNFFPILSSVKNLLSKLCILCIAVWWIFSFALNKRWTKNPIEWDVISYYAYLPATFIYKDITLNFIEKNPRYFGMKFWPETSPNGGRVIKTSMGVSILYAPFFFLGHLYAGITDEPQDGFSVPYQVFLQIGTLLYVLLGFIFLRKLLLKYFSDKITFLTLFSVFFGTNLLFYTTGAALMAHAYLFSVSCIFLFAVDKWYIKPDTKTSVLMGLTGGMLALMKPTMLVCVLIPLLWGITNLKSLKEKIKFIESNKWKLFLTIFFFILPGIPQLLYWKYITGNWFYFSYTGEQFFFDSPHILWGWFSYRNGWLLYTPIMVFALAGFFFMKEKIKHMTFPILLLFALYAYIIHSWWCWWHGGYGLRAYIELYGTLALPMATFYDFLLKKKNVVRISVLIATFLLIALNLFQTWQFEKGILHYAWMTKKSYWLGFLKTNVGGAYWQCLKETDCERIVRGLPELDEKENVFARYDVIKEIGFEDILKNIGSVYYSSTIFNSGKRSLILASENTFSPSINLNGGEVLNPTLKGKRLVSVRFLPKEEIEPEEVKLIVSIKNDTGIYYHHAQDFYSVSSDPEKWNSISFEIPLQEIKSNNDVIKIYVLSENSNKEIFIDDLKYQIGHFK